jgi:hypothetical protein
MLRSYVLTVSINAQNISTISISANIYPLAISINAQKISTISINAQMSTD